MLQSYEAVLERGRLHWVDTPPDLEHARVIVTVLPTPDEAGAAHRRRRPPERLRGVAQSVGDLLDASATTEEWEAMLDRTAGQIEGRPESFR